jgi:hypothetical protein
MAGSLQYLTLIASVVYYVSQFMQALCESHLIAAKRILHYLKGTLNIGLHHVLCPLTTITSYYDADLIGSVTDRQSTTR